MTFTLFGQKTEHLRWMHYVGGEDESAFHDSDFSDGDQFLIRWGDLKYHFKGPYYQMARWIKRGIDHYGTHGALDDNTVCHCIVARNIFDGFPATYGGKWESFLSIHYFCSEHKEARQFISARRAAKPQRISIKPSLKAEILARDKRTCQMCGAKAPDVKLHIDHRMPVKEGGTNDKSNLWTLCEECNLGKAAHVFESLLHD